MGVTGVRKTEMQKSLNTKLKKKFLSSNENNQISKGTLYDEKYAWLDQMFSTMVGRASYSLSPASISLSYCDWLLQLLLMPGKQQELLQKTREAIKCLFDNSHKSPTQATIDKRFLHSGWNFFPFSFYKRAHLISEALWAEIFTTVPGVSSHHKDILNYIARQANNLYSPTNFVLTNPEVLETTIQQSGANLVRGLTYLIEDYFRHLTAEESESLKKFKPGRDLAMTPGKVVFKNDLIELIQYSPTTDTVYEEPLLFVPAWIMKYYILDLSPHNSLVKYMVNQGHTVFMISWKNPTYADQNIGFDEYVNLGVLAALKEIEKICGASKIHACGYCLGGTLLSMAASYLAKQKNNPLKTVTMLAAQIDFEEAGEILLFVDDNQVNFLQNIMKKQGYLDKKQLKGSFEMIRSYDLIWSYRLRRYLLGLPEELSDMKAWNSDETRLPYRMHSDYLEKLYLHNSLAEGHFQINGDTLSVRDISCPIFSVSTIRDHISPWKSVYKIHLLSNTEVTYVLASGGHNMGVISEPGHPKGNFQIRTSAAEDIYIAPEDWQKETPLTQGSWWVSWKDWLKEHSSSEKINPPPLGSAQEKPLPDAPGTFIFEP